MEMFDVHRRDLFDFDEYMNLKNPGFGGPSSAKMDKDEKGKKIDNGEVKLEGYRNVVERHPAFSHEVFDPTYKAMGGDLVHKQEVGENPYDYPDRYENMGIPVVEVGERETNESINVLSYEEFTLNEQSVAPSRETEEVEAPTRPGTEEDSPSRPPKRRTDPAPKNEQPDVELVKALAAELDIPLSEAEWLLNDGEVEEESEEEIHMGKSGYDTSCGCNP